MNFQPVDRAVMFVVLGQAFETRLIQILIGVRNGRMYYTNENYWF